MNDAQIRIAEDALLRVLDKTEAALGYLRFGKTTAAVTRANDARRLATTAWEECVRAKGDSDAE